MDWISIEEPAPEGDRLLFYSPECDYIFVGVTRRGRWFDEADYDERSRSIEIVGVTHWMPIAEKPFRVTLND